MDPSLRSDDRFGAEDGLWQWIGPDHEHEHEYDHEHEVEQAREALWGWGAD